MRRLLRTPVPAGPTVSSQESVKSGFRRSMACLTPFPLNPLSEKPKIAELSVSICAEQQRTEVLAACFSLSESADGEFLLWA